MSDNNQKILEKLIKENKYNYICADCDAKCPRWASVNIGVFLCYNCASIHRGLGTHISYIKSINLDEWNDNMIKNMINNGNEKVNKKYEANLNISKPYLNDDIEKKRYFIEKKYKNKQFYKDIDITENEINNKTNNLNNENIMKDLLNFDNIENNKKKENIEDLFNFANQDNTLFFENQIAKNNNIENKIENINNLINQQKFYEKELFYQPQIYQQQLYQQQIYQQQIYQQQLYQQQLYQQQLYQQQLNQQQLNQQQLYQQQLYQQQLYQQQMYQNQNNKK